MLWWPLKQTLIQLKKINKKKLIPVVSPSLSSQEGFHVSTFKNRFEKGLHEKKNINCTIIRIFPLSNPIKCLKQGVLRIKENQDLFWSSQNLQNKGALISLVEVVQKSTRILDTRRRKQKKNCSLIIKIFLDYTRIRIKDIDYLLLLYQEQE
jgi:hypothetical protein